MRASDCGRTAPYAFGKHVRGRAPPFDALRWRAERAGIGGRNNDGHGAAVVAGRRGGSAARRAVGNANRVRGQAPQFGASRWPRRRTNGIELWPLQTKYTVS
jgi:hypothetical protein